MSAPAEPAASPAQAPLQGVLVTGATAPLGRGLVRHLLQRANVAHVLAVGIEDRPPFDLARDERVTYVALDLARDRNVRALLFGAARDLRVETIVHTAMHRRAVHGGSRVHRQNVESTRLFLELCERHPTIRHFVLRSHAEVYRVQAEDADVLKETHPLELSGRAPQWIRDRVEADLLACTHMGVSGTRISVLRCAEILANDVGSQLWDYLESRIGFVPLGYDPMLNLLSLDDAVRALGLAVVRRAQGIFNIAGKDTLPLSRAIRQFGRRPIPAPAFVIGPLYGLRRLALGTDFRWDLNAWRFHYSGVLDGRHARETLGYEPQHAIEWPHR
jgi:UDP-glucose 4-epimerase